MLVRAVPFCLGSWVPIGLGVLHHGGRGRETKVADSCTRRPSSISIRGISTVEVVDVRRRLVRRSRRKVVVLVREFDPVVPEVEVRWALRVI